MTAKPLTKLLEKEVDRKEFLMFAGFILLTLTGISSVMKNVSSIVQDKQQKGFSSGPYGK